MGDGAVGAGSTIAGRFRLVRVLAAGEISTLYEATATNGRKWALRLLDPAHEGEVRERFVREARRAAGVKSENVVDVREVDGKHRPPFLVEQLLDGFDLETLLARASKLRPEIAARIALQAVRGLEAEALDGVQRAELAPTDVFLHRSSAEGVVVKLADSTTRLLPSSSATLVSQLGRALFAMLLGRAPTAEDDVAAPSIDPVLRRIVRDAIDDVVTLSEIAARLASFIEGSPSIATKDLGPSGLADAMFRRNDGTPTDSPDILDVPEEDAPPTALLGETLGEKYRLERLIGHGGMGAVYEARGPNGATVAVKVVLGDHRKPEALRRFVREARTATAIESPYVVRVLEVDGDRARGVPYIVMELLRGIDLEQTITDHGPLEADLVARIFVQACTGLAAVHEKGVVHRDIKPSNIFLARGEDTRLTTKICDFGVAKQLQRELEREGAQSTDLTHTGSMIGSPPYMSPEQARSSKDIDERSDVWSLGASLYEALSGRRLWEGRSSLGELMAAIIREPVPRLEDVAPWVDPGLAAVVTRTLEKDKTLRFASMNELAEALEPYAMSESVFVSSAVRTVSDVRRSAVPRFPSPRVETTSSFARSGPARQSHSKAAGIVIVAVLSVAVGLSELLIRRARPVPIPATQAVVASTAVAPSVSSMVVAPPSIAVVTTAATTSAPHVAVAASPKAVPKAATTTAPKASTTTAPKASNSVKKPDDDAVPNIF